MVKQIPSYYKHVGYGICTYVNVESQEFNIRHVSCPEYLVKVKFGYMKKPSFSNIIADGYVADREFWEIVAGALIHTINKETCGA